ncbi:hypothetical protein FB451DRAFT_1287331 [Mycena latifolia]|nr:hypothetical protein FB451DRAFT_1287331 [Mycena latifolia]
MLTASESELSALGGRERKAEELDPESIYSFILERLRKERFFSSIEEDEWEELSAKILVDPQLPAPTIISKPFTESGSFYNDVFQNPVGTLSLREDVGEPILSRVDKNPSSTPSDPSDRIYHEAAATLQNNVLWKSVQEHVVIDNETSCRTAIDLVLLTAVDLAQQQIAEKQDVDEALRARHLLTGPKCPDSDGREVGSWVVLHQKVDIPEQLLLPGIALHGILDYLLGVVSASNDSHLTNLGLYVPPDLVQYIGKSLASIVDAKASIAMDNKKAWAQVTAQGAALCVLTKRPSVINILTDGLRWQFVRVTKIPDQVPPSQGGKAARSKRSDQTASASVSTDRRMSKRLAAKSPELHTVSETQPFKAASTRILNIFQGRDLAVVLRLLTVAILSSPEEFEELAAAAH